MLAQVTLKYFLLAILIEETIMGDTLETIYTGTLTASSFTNNVATLLTTNSATRHAIKDIYVTQGATEYSIAGSLKINGTTVLSSLNNSVSGLAIVGPSEAVTVTTTSLPIPYTDAYIGTGGVSSNTVNSITFPQLGGSDAAAAETPTQVVVPSDGIANNTTQRAVWTNLPDGGSDDAMVVTYTDGNSTTNAYYYPDQTTATGRVVINTGTYSPKVFDGTRYVYYMNNAQYLARYDTLTQTNLPTYFAFTPIRGYNMATLSTYAKMFMMGPDKIMFWPQYNSNGDGPYVFTPSTQAFESPDAGMTFTVNSFFGVGADAWAGTQLSDGTYRMVKRVNAQGIRVYTWAPGDLWAASARPYTEYTGLGTQNTSYSIAAVGDNFYFTKNNDTQLRYINLLTGVEGLTGTSVASPGATTNPNPNSGLWGALKTPTASQIAGRTYTIDPSISLRITGVTST